MMQTFSMLGQLEDLAAIYPFAFEDAAAIVQAMGQHVDLGVAPLNHLAIEPDHAIAIMKREH